MEEGAPTGAVAERKAATVRYTTTKQGRVGRIEVPFLFLLAFQSPLGTSNRKVEAKGS